MKTLLLFFVSLIAFGDAIFDKQVTGIPELWNVTDGIDTPESVFYHKDTDAFYVSNIAGKADQKDGKGWITKIQVGKNGKPNAVMLVNGLNAPKGIRVHGETLWVADVDTLVGISLKDGGKTALPIEGAKFLNDVATDSDGRVFVSDTLTSTIYVAKDGKVEVFAKGKDLESPNGLIVDDDKLYVGSWGLTKDFLNKTAGRLYYLDLKTKKKHPITKKPMANFDGLELDGDGGYIASDWVKGTVFRVSKDGKATPLLEGFKGAADIAYVEKTQTLVVPSMGENKIIAYKLPNT